jgi:4'-phosphopantetheinyl transferase EntD
LGFNPSEILPRSTRDPEWPPGLIGSISHCNEHVIALVCPSARISGVGIDLEESRITDKEFGNIVCLQEEKASIQSIETFGVDGALLYFVAKEAFYKAFFPERQKYLDFHDVKITFNLQEKTFLANVHATRLAIEISPHSIGHFYFDAGLLSAVFLIHSQTHQTLDN